MSNRVPPESVLGPQMEALKVDLLTAAAALTCPRCGTSSPRCRVWAGGPGHTSGMHESRLALARQALTRQPADLVTGTAPVAVELTLPAAGSAPGHPVLPGRRRHQEVSAA